MFHYIVELVKALAWPVAVVWLGYVFRSEIRKLMARITQVKHGETEVNFAKELAKVEAESQKVQSGKPVPEESVEALSKEDQLLRIAATSPRAAITEAWVMVENALIDKGFSAGVAIPRFSPRSIVGLAAVQAGISPDLSELIQGLRKLRNHISHDANLSPTQEQAEAYIRSAIRSIDFINNRFSKA